MRKKPSCNTTAQTMLYKLVGIHVYLLIESLLGAGMPSSPYSLLLQLWKTEKG